ncbi:MAG: N-acetylglucosamine-6-phosphate deacetylase, partial [Oscillospiraceae bacterium]|nr:N-acetylglucosamine-6-phosphate deacetylase [Oscillospiraceae bacterium]
MLFKNALLFRGGRFVPGAFRVEDGRFAAFYDEDPAGDGVDLGGAKVIPGLIDVHSHGNSGADF